MEPEQLDRVVVIGASCAGKSAFARSLASSVQAPHVELDALFWKSGWKPRDATEFIDLVEHAVSDNRWVMDGNYSAVRDLIWRRATGIIWLDYSFPVVFSRAVRRTVKRVLTREMVHGGNRETFRNAFLSRDGIPCWVIRTFGRRRNEYRQLFASPEYAHINRTILRRSCDAEALLGEVSRLPTKNNGRVPSA